MKLNKKFIGFICGLIIAQSGFSQTALYDRSTVQEIRIYFHESNWDFILDTLKINDSGYLQADSLFLNGIKFDSVGVKYKGNSSYDSSQVKNPFTIKLDKYVSSQNYLGYTSLKLANCYDDPSMIREALAYAILSNYMHCPQSNFAKIYVNDNLIGLYSNDEDITKKFALKHFYSSGNPFFKASPVLASPAIKSSLKYIDANSTSYETIYEKESNAASGWTDFIALCDTVTNSPSNIASVLDIDRAIWMLAFDNILVNLDSYLGVFSQNYYLYKDGNGIWNPIVWDLNMSFGSFNFLGTPGNGMGTMAVSDMQILSPLAHSTHTDWPLVRAIFINDQYKRKYIAHYRTILNEMFANDYYKTLATNFQTTIASSVIADTNKFFTDVEFQNGMTQNKVINGRTVPGIENLMDARVSFLQADAEILIVAPTVTDIQLSSYNPASGTTIHVTVSAMNANFVECSHRSDSILKFTSTTLYDDGLHTDGISGDGIFGGDVAITSAYTEYYVYAENTNAGIFFPARAEHEFYTLPGNAPVLGIKESSIETSDWSIYPNPTTGSFTVKINSEYVEGTLEIIDLLGNSVLKTPAKSVQEVSTENWTSGTYFIQIGSKREKLMLIR
ncbi:CotH kinase family protein [Fluviicola sp.]|uniref:CotH kinase family protein n=1 Tax=Fluviicola sp. TaxID=1917219 RepID=UPI003D29BCA8